VGITLLVLLAAIVAGLARWAWRRPDAPSGPPPDPRLGYSGPFLNVHPDVVHAGDSACAACHLDVTRPYGDHPMGRSLTPVADRIEEVADARAAAGFTALGSRFQVERHGQRLWHRQTRLDAGGRPIYTLEHEVHYVIGSGTRGTSFLSDKGGYLFQSPISWFQQKQVWGLSPGFDTALLSGRPVAAECLFCHANRVRPRPDTVNGYQLPVFDGHAIGCERCHGPGERHAQERTHTSVARGAVDFTIVNPLVRQDNKPVLSPALRDAVCEQCHLEGEVRVLRRGRHLDDFRPGMALQPFWSVFVHDRSAEGAEKAVNHVEQMHQSRCYLHSSGERKLGCVSCHDPHEKIAASRRVSFYRGRCLQCHREHGCSLPAEVRLRESKQDICIDCHMPPYSASDIPHTAATDHRIVRRRGQRAADQPGPKTARSLVSFFEPTSEADGRELARDRGIALARLAAEGKADAGPLARQAVDLLREALAAHPDDVPAWEAQGSALTALERPAEALTAFETALRWAPRSEPALRTAARLAQESGDQEKALDYWRRALDSNPQMPDYHGNLALLLAHGHDWEEASRECRLWLQLDPGSREARRLWVRCLTQQGDRAGARVERDLLRRLE
jgi:predicted CXXCH cytochrome family protein